MYFLTDYLDDLGFFCGIRNVLYIRDICQFTSLVIEQDKCALSSTPLFRFYKASYHPYSGSLYRVKIYAEKVPVKILLKRVSDYIAYYEKTKK